MNFQNIVMGRTFRLFVGLYLSAMFLWDLKVYRDVLVDNWNVVVVIFALELYLIIGVLFVCSVWCEGGVKHS